MSSFTPAPTAATASSTNLLTLRFTDGPQHFRSRIVCSLLSRRPLLIKNIRSDDTNPGLRDYEASFLRLIDQITNGTTIEINETGTQVKLRPGMLVGGMVDHECPVSRGVGWFLEPLLVLGGFGKEDLR